MNDSASKSSFDNLDTQYKPFPPFSKWASLHVDTVQWDALKIERDALLSAQEDSVKNNSIRNVTRMAAYDTGALEKLYETDRGITYSFATYVGPENLDGIDFVDSSKEQTLRFVQSQLNAYELTLDAVTQKTPISEAWLRRLHETICESQDTYTVVTAVGKQEVKLPKGTYKTNSNHVRLADGAFFAYAPVKDTESEVRRLIEEIRSDEFQSAHSIAQAAYAHYSLVLIHPFADGNGRLCRVLASLYLYRDSSIPLLIFSDQRDEYLNSLRQADKQNFQAFVDFISQRSFEALELQSLFIQNQRVPSTQISFDKIRNSLKQAEFTPSELDALANKLQRIVLKQFQTEIVNQSWISGISANAKITTRTTVVTHMKKGFRIPRQKNDKKNHLILNVVIQSALGDGTTTQTNIPVYVESNNLLTPDIKLGTGEMSLRVSATEIRERKQTFNLKVRIWVENQFSGLLDQFQKAFSPKYSEE